MKTKIFTSLVSIILCFSMLCGIGGVFAVWIYPYDPDSKESAINATAESFNYGTKIYITEVGTPGGEYTSASVTKTGDVTVNADITLQTADSAAATVDITLYNPTDIMFYYNETAITTDSTGVICTVSGLLQKDSVPAKSYTTLTLTFSHATQGTVISDFSGSLEFKFTVDKDSIGDIVANEVTAKFEEILNEPIDYGTLTEAMNDRGSGAWNAGSSVTYIGNVAGATTGDSQAIVDLFGEEGLNMDLDGDGQTEPVTIMIKRENLDDNVTTGDYYTYQNRNGQDITVNGVEMTVYITAEDFGDVSRGDSVVVYATVFTKFSGSDEWVQVISRTRGTAEANNYDGSWFGAANSFNTDTWVDENGTEISTLVKNELNYL